MLLHPLKFRVLGSCFVLGRLYGVVCSVLSSLAPYHGGLVSLGLAWNCGYMVMVALKKDV